MPLPSLDPDDEFVGDGATLSTQPERFDLPP
jgi:hypothetical protein